MWDDETRPKTGDRPRWGWGRPPAASGLERFVERRLSARLGWRLDVVRGLQAADGTASGNGSFRVLSPGSFFLPWNRTPALLRVATWYRFGNAVRQLQNAFIVAEHYGVKRIEFANVHPFFEGSRSGPFELTWGQPCEPRRRIGLEGSFFFLQGLGQEGRPDAQARVFTAHIRHLLTSALREPDGRVDEGDLILHFRGGDVFRAKGIHPSYGQPPLNYYLAAVERERPSRVWLVFEDRANPCVGAVEAALHARGIEVVAQSSDLGADLRVLLSAKRLVAGNGSFCVAVAALSTRLQKLYLFEKSVPVLRRLGIDVVRAVDRSGNYRRHILSENWAASPQQLALMLSYPAECIEFCE
jgi:hypothetical protein